MEEEGRKKEGRKGSEETGTTELQNVEQVISGAQ